MAAGTHSESINREIARILLSDWNPLRPFASEDEYSGYIPGIRRLLDAGADLFKMAAHLSQIEVVSMGIAGDEARCRAVAEKLLAIGRDKGGTNVQH